MIFLATPPFASVASAAPATAVKSANGEDRNPTDAKSTPDAKSAVDAKSNPDAKRTSAAAPADKKPVARFGIDEYRVEGADLMRQIEVEEAVYPFLGPGRTADDVEKARAALEKAYASKGYQTVTVSIPQQNVANGIVVLKVVEAKVGRLRVKDSRFFDTDTIKAKAPSLSEGKLPNFNDVTKDIVSLNQLPDRKVTPALRAGATPGTVDVDLKVEDKWPAHGSVEITNRQSPNTKPLRLTASARYDNLWQRGDSLSFSYQVAIQHPDDAKVLSGSYLARTSADWLNLLVYAVDSKSDVATVGGQTVIGPGGILGTRAVITLPSRENFFQTMSVGFDYKHFGENVAQGGTLQFSTPVTYIPIVGNYTATWQREGGSTQFNTTATMGVRGLGSEPVEFDSKRFGAKENFFHIRGDLSTTQDVKGGLQLYVRAQGQLADQPLVSSEQFSMGGVDTVRGYLETEALGDAAVAGTVELRTPNLGEWIAGTSKDAQSDPHKTVAVNDWRFFVFGDGGRAQILKPLPEQSFVFDLASYGVGTRLKLFERLNGMLVFAVPIINQTFTFANKPRVLFRASGEF